MTYEPNDPESWRDPEERYPWDDWRGEEPARPRMTISCSGGFSVPECQSGGSCTYDIVREPSKPKE